jgi:hypothetical protein
VVIAIHDIVSAQRQVRHRDLVAGGAGQAFEVVAQVVAEVAHQPAAEWDRLVGAGQLVLAQKLVQQVERVAGVLTRTVAGDRDPIALCREHREWVAAHERVAAVRANAHA